MRILREEHLNTLLSMENLAWTYKRLARTVDATDLRQKAVARSQKVLGDEHPNTVARKSCLTSWIGTIITNQLNAEQGKGQASAPQQSRSDQANVFKSRDERHRFVDRMLGKLRRHS